MPWSETLPQFSLAGTLLTVLLLLFAAFGEPFLGRLAFARLARSRHDGGRALRRLYAVTVATHALWGVLVLAVLLLSPGLGAGDLGLRFPAAWGPIAGGAVGGLVALAVLWTLANGLPFRRSGRGRKGGRKGSGHRGSRASAAPAALPEPGRHPQGLLVPRTTVERLLAGGAAVTGGVFGELLYRGLFIVLVAGMGVPLWIAALLSVLLFSVAHVYQGWWGLVSAGASGALFTILYLGTESLWVPMAVHVALNLRSLVFPPASARADLGDEGYEDEYDDGGPDHDDPGYDERGYDERGYEDHGQGERTPGGQAYDAHAQGGRRYDSHGYDERGDQAPGGQEYDSHGYDERGYEDRGHGEQGPGGQQYDPHGHDGRAYDGHGHGPGPAYPDQPYGVPAPQADPRPYEERYGDRAADPHPYPPGPGSPYGQPSYGEQYERTRRDRP
ncbi:CPBP family intramembrane glutamic endopeptidase [Nocardiopsis sp. NRRL B-16309]|uniref:CPBP family intramembrane glutamic endopeptidase n=1 Tax=Nocardiopsis sp. NRRL B-16309 TaxID=1519494 RepID=UPI0006AD92E0|nr:CPBP family intramembrane glutamic endopeptidase [Nocardiopsis sp. NRRL B-16309]